MWGGEWLGILKGRGQKRGKSGVKTERREGSEGDFHQATGSVRTIHKRAHSSTRTTEGNEEGGWDGTDGLLFLTGAIKGTWLYKRVLVRLGGENPCASPGSGQLATGSVMGSLDLLRSCFPA